MLNDLWEVCFFFLFILTVVGFGQMRIAVWGV